MVYFLLLVINLHSRCCISRWNLNVQLKHKRTFQVSRANIIFTKAQLIMNDCILVLKTRAYYNFVTKTAKLVERNKVFFVTQPVGKTFYFLITLYKHTHINFNNQVPTNKLVMYVLRVFWVLVF